METFKSFINLKSNENHDSDNFSVNSDLSSNSSIENMIQLEINEEKAREENHFLSMLEEINNKADAIINNKKENKLSDDDIKKINEMHQNEINQLKSEIHKKSKKLKFYYYSLVGLNATLALIGLIYSYRSNSTDEKIKNQIDNSTFKATRLNNDSWLFKSQPKGSLIQLAVKN